VPARTPSLAEKGLGDRGGGPIPEKRESRGTAIRGVLLIYNKTHREDIKKGRRVRGLQEKKRGKRNVNKERHPEKKGA